MPLPIDFRNRLTRERPYGHDQVDLKLPSCSFEQLAVALESDRGRIINSAAVRRLQQRTQVFPLERNAAGRSRLTHSLEVQQTGRFIVRTLYQLLGDKGADYGLQGLQPLLETLVEMGCLLHDVGNPPFGHFGEYAISQWFTTYLKSQVVEALPEGDELAQRMRADLSHFEGNAQGIRLVAHLQRLNLTYSQSACLLKYLRPAYVNAPDGASYCHKKPGFYLSEEGFVRNLQHSQGLAENARHPLVYIVEAADDISYCLADIEDSVEKGILSVDQLTGLLVEQFARLCEEQPEGDKRLAWFCKQVDQARQRSDTERINKVGEYFIALRVNMIHPLVRHAASQFITHIENIYTGSLNRALIEDHSLEHQVVQTFKEVAQQRVFNHPEVDSLQLKGYRIIHGILDGYHSLLGLSARDFQPMVEDQDRQYPYQQMLVRRLPQQLLKAYVQAVSQSQHQEQPERWEFYYRCRLLQDFVSGLTDQQAQDEYHHLTAL